jgi:hypothetical protein
MTSRLVYSPKVYVFTKNSQGTLLNLTPYVVSGQVQREINQVSSASVILRNPYRIFTTPSGGNAAFHPQDPITIYLERIAGFPIRVFTGYLDTTPYYQLQPNTITLQASCTLKRLLYTFFDPAVPAVMSLFTQYGWQDSGSGTLFTTSGYDPKNLSDFNTGSFAQLLWAVLYNIGQWDDTNIWIEPLPAQGPDGIIARITSLASTMAKEDKEAANYLTSFLNTIVGTGGQGSGGGTAGGGALFTGGPLSSASGLTVKGTAMNATQLSYANQILSIGATMGATGTAIATVLLQAICESSMGTPGEFGWDSGNPNYGGLLAGSISNFGSLGAANSSAVTAAEIKAAFSGNKGFNYPGSILNLSSGTNIAQAAMTNSGSGTQYEQEATKSGTSLSVWAQEAQSIVNAAQDATSSTKPTKGAKGKKSSTTQKSSTSSSSAASGSNTVFDCILMAANGLANSGLPYPSPDSHFGDLGTEWPAYDCSGSVSYTLYAAGLMANNTSGFASGGEEAVLTAAPINAVAGKDNSAGAVNIYVNPAVHTFMEINGTNGRYWGTTDGTVVAPGCGQWLSQGNTTPANAADPAFAVYHIPQAILKQSATYQGPIAAGGTGIPASGLAGTTGSGLSTTGSTGSTGGSSALGDAFYGELTFPTAQEQANAIVLGQSGKGLLMDQSLMPFVQQLTQACLRSFMSLPNGDFYAFYPDYFGETGAHDPYWEIYNIEILEGTISLTDDALATHVFVVGDNMMIDTTILGQASSTSASGTLADEMISTSMISVLNAFQSGIVTTNVDANGVTQQDSGFSAVMNSAQAQNFIKRYGARPLIQNYPNVHSPLFETFLAYQQFMEAWSNQFKSTFAFTFMPEVFPGGKVAFPEHGFKMFVQSVTHTFDYEAGFTTDATLTSPSLYGAGNADLPPNMVGALAEPVTTKPTGNVAKTEGTPNVHVTPPINGYEGVVRVAGA